MEAKINALAKTLEDNPNTLLSCLLKFWKKQCPTLNNEEISDSRSRD